MKGVRRITGNFNSLDVNLILDNFYDDEEGGKIFERRKRQASILLKSLSSSKSF